jgi:hypothetical protein
MMTGLRIEGIGGVQVLTVYAIKLASLLIGAHFGD